LKGVTTVSTRLLTICAVLFALLSFGYGSQNKAENTSLPSRGVVPNEITAVKIAEAVFLPIYGEEEVSKYRPYEATLKGGVWTVFGTLKPGARGGTPTVTIQKSDGKVIDVWFSQ
jgi:hypothetical protein